MLTAKELHVGLANRFSSARRTEGSEEEQNRFRPQEYVILTEGGPACQAGFFAGRSAERPAFAKG